MRRQRGPLRAQQRLPGDQHRGFLMPWVVTLILYLRAPSEARFRRGFRLDHEQQDQGNQEPEDAECLNEGEAQEQVTLLLWSS